MKQFSEDKVTIRIRVKRASVESMRSQPLHSSQREVETTDRYTDFEYVVAPTQELYAKLLSYGSSVEVLAPNEARLEMYNRIMNMSFIYSEEMARTKIGKAVIYAANKSPKANIARVRHSLEMQRGIGYLRRLDACMLYLEATQGWEYERTLGSTTLTRLPYSSVAIPKAYICVLRRWYVRSCVRRRLALLTIL